MQEALGVRHQPCAAERAGVRRHRGRCPGAHSLTPAGLHKESSDGFARTQ
jgi:hypothetical protein